MRPSDENQSRSKRPNLFSSSHRPAGGDDNILAKLEKHPPAPLAASAESRTRVIWLSAAGVVIAGLIITLATLAQENAVKPRALSRAAESVSANELAPAPVVTLASGRGNEALDQAALIVEEAAPPLVTLGGAVKAPVHTAALAPAPAPAGVTRHGPAKPSTPAPRTSAARPFGPFKSVLARNDNVLLRPAAPRAAAPLASNVAHKPRPAGPLRSEAPVIDTDVALLAALLAQSRQIAERDQQERACTGAKCPAKPSSQQ